MIITLSGASGTGKTTIEKTLRDALPHAKPVVSVTTRAPRPNDLPGDFLYLTPEAFKEKQERGEFLWTTQVGDTRHGTMTTSLLEAFRAPEKTWIMVLVPECVPRLHTFAEQQRCMDHIRSFYILNPPDDILRQRMLERGDTPEHVEERMRACRAFQEYARASGVPYIYVPDNNDLEEKCAIVLKGI